jgi:hypothetical protein
MEVPLALTMLRKPRRSLTRMPLAFPVSKTLSKAQYRMWTTLFNKFGDEVLGEEGSIWQDGYYVAFEQRQKHNLRNDAWHFGKM